MASRDRRQLTTIAQRLGRINPVRMVSRMLRELRTAPPGDPAELRGQAAAFRTAADAIDRIGVHAPGTAKATDGWRGTVATSAEQVAKATTKAFTNTPTALRAAADALDSLATGIDEQQRRHAELRRAPLPRRIRGCSAVHTDAIAAADAAAGAFADVAGQARVAAAVSGGFEPADAVVLAGWEVRVRGIGDDYDDGILTTAQLTMAGRRLADAGAAVRALLAGAGSDTERAYLLKAIAAGRPADELEAFAEAIRGRNDDWLHGHLTLIDRGGAGEQDRVGAEVDQCDPYTCGTTSLIVARAEADPVYALSLTCGPPEAFDQRLSAEQARVHDTTNLIYPERWGTTPEGMADWMSEQCGTAYRWHLVDDTNQREATTALREVVTAVNTGHPVPVLVGGIAPRHYVLAVGHARDALLIFEPTSGATVRVPTADFIDGRLAQVAGFDHVQAVVLPRHPVEDVEFPH